VQPREPKEVSFLALDLPFRAHIRLQIHSWHKDGLRRSQEGQGQKQLDHLPKRGQYSMIELALIADVDLTVNRLRSLSAQAHTLLG